MHKQRTHLKGELYIFLVHHEPFRGETSERARAGREARGSKDFIVFTRGGAMNMDAIK